LYKIVLNGITNKYGYDELIKVFLRPEEYSLLCDSDGENLSITLQTEDDNFAQVLEFNETEKNILKQAIYQKLCDLTEKKPEWGIHTGVRPVKLIGELFNKLGTMDAVIDKLKNFYLFDDEKIALICNT